MAAGVRLRQATLMLGVDAGSGEGAAGCCTCWHDGFPDPLADFSFDPPLPMVRTKRGTGRVPRLTASPKRSARSDCNIRLAVAGVVPSGTFAPPSNRSSAIQPGPPERFFSETLYAD